MDENDRLRAVCAEAYQAVGAMAAELEIVSNPEIIRLMDNLDAASTGDPIPHESKTGGFSIPDPV